MNLSLLNKKRRLISILSFMISVVAVSAADVIDPSGYFRLLPKPQKIEWLKGKGVAAHAIKSIHLQGNARKPLLSGILNVLPVSSMSGKGVVTLNISNHANLPASGEGYILEINQDKLSITSREQAGLFYGCQTLSQLIQDAREQNIEIPSCKISDYPEQPYRAIHLDLKHHVDAGHYYYSIIDRLAAAKVNAVIVEFEDKLRYRKAPVVGSGNAISVDEFAAITRYAKDRHIEISPLVQGLGHASFILKHDQYKSLRDDPKSDWAFDALNPGTYDLQFALYEDAIAATPGSRYLHVGGDEVGKLGMSALAKQSGMQPFELQMYWLNKVCQFAQQHNRIPIFWDDMVFKLSGLYETTYEENIPAKTVDSIWKVNEHRLNQNIEKFPRNCIYMRWNYWNPTIPGNRRAIDWYKKHNLKVMAATAAQTNWPMMPRDNSNIKSIKQFCKVASDQKMDGILCTTWDDASPHFETIWRGLYYFASYSWNAEDDKVEDANSLFRHRFYGSSLADAGYEFQNALEKALTFWETALIEKGHRYNYPDSIWLIALPDASKAGAWNHKYADKISRAKEEEARYKDIRRKISKSQLPATRNHYSLHLFNQINELQVYPSRLLLMISAYDSATSNSRKETSRQQIQQLVKDFTLIRKEFEEVYAATRFISNPAGYVMDQNDHHHLANGTLNSDWMYVFELAMNKKIEHWEPFK